MQKFTKFVKKKQKINQPKVCDRKSEKIEKTTKVQLHFFVKNEKLTLLILFSMLLRSLAVVVLFVGGSLALTCVTGDLDFSAILLNFALF